MGDELDDEFAFEPLKALTGGAFEPHFDEEDGDGSDGNDGSDDDDSVEFNDEGQLQENSDDEEDEERYELTFSHRLLSRTKIDL